MDEMSYRASPGRESAELIKRLPGAKANADGE